MSYAQAVTTMISHFYELILVIESETEGESMNEEAYNAMLEEAMRTNLRLDQFDNNFMINLSEGSLQKPPKYRFQEFFLTRLLSWKQKG